MCFIFLTQLDCVAPIQQIPINVTMETQSSQLCVSSEVVIRHLGDVVERKIQSECAVRYHGNTGESKVSAVAGELQVAAMTGRPLGLRV